MVSFFFNFFFFFFFLLFFRFRCSADLTCPSSAVANQSRPTPTDTVPAAVRSEKVLLHQLREPGPSVGGALLGQELPALAPHHPLLLLPAHGVHQHPAQVRLYSRLGADAASASLCPLLLLLSLPSTLASCTCRGLFSRSAPSGVDVTSAGSGLGVGYSSVPVGSQRPFSRASALRLRTSSACFLRLSCFSFASRSLRSRLSCTWSMRCARFSSLLFWYCVKCSSAARASVCSIWRSFSRRSCSRFCNQTEKGPRVRECVGVSQCQ